MKNILQTHYPELYWFKKKDETAIDQLLYNLQYIKRCNVYAISFTTQKLSKWKINISETWLPNGFIAITGKCKELLNGSTLDAFVTMVKQILGFRINILY